MPDSILYGLGGLLAFQTYVTVRVVMNKVRTRQEKWRQLLFVWLIPFIGAASTLSLLASDSKTPARPDK